MHTTKERGGKTTIIGPETRVLHALCCKIQTEKFNVQKAYSVFKDFIQCSKIPFNVQKFHSKFKDFIQCSIFSFKVQKVYSKFKKFIQSSKCSFKVQKAYSKFKNFYSIYKHKDIISFL